MQVQHLRAVHKYIFNTSAPSTPLRKPQVAVSVSLFMNIGIITWFSSLSSDRGFLQCSKLIKSRRISAVLQNLYIWCHTPASPDTPFYFAGIYILCAQSDGRLRSQNSGTAVRQTGQNCGWAASSRVGLEPQPWDSRRRFSVRSKSSNVTVITGILPKCLNTYANSSPPQRRVPCGGLIRDTETSTQRH